MEFGTDIMQSMNVCVCVCVCEKCEVQTLSDASSFQLTQFQTCPILKKGGGIMKQQKACHMIAQLHESDGTVLSCCGRSGSGRWSLDFSWTACCRHMQLTICIPNSD